MSWKRHLWVMVLLAVSFYSPLVAARQPVDLVWATNAHPTRSLAVQNFERQNPGVRIRILPISTPWKLQLQCHFGRCPDILTFFHPGAFQSFAQDDLLLPLPDVEYWPHWPGLKSYGYRETDKVRMAEPQVAYPYVLYYNSDLVSPETAKKIRDWDDLRTVAMSVIHQNTSARKVFGVEIHSDLIWFQTLVFANGGNLRGHPDSFSHVKAALRQMREWRSMPNLVPSPADRRNVPSSGSSQGVLGSLFLQGRAAFYWSGSWKLWSISQQDRIPWRVRTIPSGTIGPVTLLGGNSFGVYRGTKHPDDAKRFVAYLGSYEAEVAHVASGILFPSRMDVPVPSIVKSIEHTLQTGRTADYGIGLDAVKIEARLKDIFEAHRMGELNDEQAAQKIMTILRLGDRQ